MPPENVEENSQVAISATVDDFDNDELTITWLQTKDLAAIDVINANASLTFVAP
jgi:hypothetical protein